MANSNQNNAPNRRQRTSRDFDEAYGSARRSSSSRSSYERSSYGNNGASSANSSRRSVRSARTADSDTHYSRSAGNSAYANRSKQRKRRSRLKVALIAIAVVVLVGAGSAWAYVNYLNGNLQSGIDSNLRNSLVQTNLTKEPFYMLLLGTDESSERDADASFGSSFRSDTIILARIDPVEKTCTLVSLPRDTQVDLGEYGTQKLNAASTLGGPALAVSTVSNLAGVGISHYASIDFDGFKEVVDSLGGIEVDVPMTIDDEDAGGHLDAGLQTLDGDQALILCRARNAYEEYGGGDNYRSANQRLVLQAIANKILDSDVATIANTVNTLSQYVTCDLSVNDIIGLAQAFQGFDASTSMYTGSMPTTSVYEDDLWYEKINQTAWSAMMKRVDAGESPTEEDIVDSTGTILASTGSGQAQSETSGDSSTSASSDHTGTVVVRNGSGVSGMAATAAEKVSAMGYTVTDTGNADSFDYSQTLVVYNDASLANQAKEIAQTLGIGQAQLNDGTYTCTDDFLVVIGSDFTQ